MLGFFQGESAEQGIGRGVGWEVVSGFIASAAKAIVRSSRPWSCG